MLFYTPDMSSTSFLGFAILAIPRSSYSLPAFGWPDDLFEKVDPFKKLPKGKGCCAASWDVGIDTQMSHLDMISWTWSGGMIGCVACTGICKSFWNNFLNDSERQGWCISAVTSMEKLFCIVAFVPTLCCWVLFLHFIFAIKGQL